MKIETVVLALVFFGLGFLVGKKNPGAQVDAFLNSATGTPRVAISPRQPVTPAPPGGWMQDSGRTSLDKPAAPVKYGSSMH